MKKRACILLFTLAWCSSVAKTTHTIGTIITKVDTISLWFIIPLQENNRINYASLQEMVTVYRSPKDTIKTIITPAQVWQIEFDFMGEHVIMSSTNNWMKFKYKRSKSDWIFLKIEAKGRSTLCSYFNPSEFSSAENYEPKHYYILYQQNKYHEQISSTTPYALEVLQKFYYDCPKIQNLNKEEFTFSEIPKLVNLYNSFACT